MTNPTGKGGFQRGRSGNPGGRPKLPADIREAFKAKVPQALEVLTRCLQSDDDRIAMMAAQAILDRGYGRPSAERSRSASIPPRAASPAGKESNSLIRSPHRVGSSAACRGVWPSSAVPVVTDMAFTQQPYSPRRHQ